MAVAGLGDPTLGTSRSRGVLGRYQPQVGADRPAREPAPVADLGGQPERRQRRNATHATEPSHYRGERRVGSQRGDRTVETVAAVDGGRHGLEGRVVGRLQPWGAETV